MSNTPHEDRFTALMHFVAGDCEVAQEFSIPRRMRRLDLVYRFDEAPLWFGALSSLCSHRFVIFEHESAPLARHALSSALVGQVWLAWKRVQPRASSVKGFQLLRETARPPLVVVVADRLREDVANAVPTLEPADASGVWCSADLDHGGLVLLNTGELRAEDGYAFWSWAGRARNPEQARERLLRLLDDPKLPILYQEQLMEALMDNQIPHTGTEKESVYQRLRRELRKEVLDEEREFLAREALLSLAARLAPDSVSELREIADFNTLELAVEEAIRTATHG
ncbi:MAG: hypothetical protein EA398_00760 [Deltaproteobacteria bacterium]|nr:MAG: hypothetical protein EA398_00760 [Deltaproteobacteria bacterium]